VMLFFRRQTTLSLVTSPEPSEARHPYSFVTMRFLRDWGGIVVRAKLDFYASYTLARACSAQNESGRISLGSVDERVYRHGFALGSRERWRGPTLRTCVSA
jgi:hypothetical protein